MKTNPDQPAAAEGQGAAALRRRAEARLGEKQSSQRSEVGGQWTTDDTVRLVHELKVHQIELEMQNEELKAARATAEALLAQYTELYDFAPAGYLTLAREGTIRQVNFTGARLLGVVRSGLLLRRFGQFVAEGDRRAFSDFLEKVFAGEAGESCEVTLPREGSQSLVVQVAAVRSADGQECRAVVLDITEHKQAEVVLRVSETKYRTLLNNLTTAVVVHGPDTAIVLFNPMALSLLGLSEDQMWGKTAMDPQWCFLQEDGSHMPLGDYPVKRVITSGEAFHGQVVGVVHQGRTQPVWVLCNGYPVKDEEGRIVQAVITFSDITERKQAEMMLRETLQQKEALLHEVHHRVKNNLQVISSLLSLEARRQLEPATKAVLEEMKGRIRSMALLHETLYLTKNFARVDLASYLREVAVKLFRALNANPSAVRLVLELAAAEVELDQAMPCGLLVNELMTNALKHGFPGDRHGEVRLGLQQTADGRVHLQVGDDGVGLPTDLDLNNAQTLGLQLVTDLTRQLQGTLEIGPGPGASFSIVFTPKVAADTAFLQPPPGPGATGAATPANEGRAP
jgi:PAS domain S-box-containing protein